MVFRTKMATVFRTLLPRVPQAMIFDWDSTLVDNWDSLTLAMNAALREFKLEEWDRARMIGNSRQSMKNSFPKIFGDDWERAGEIFYATYRRHHLRGLKTFEHAPALLELLEEHGIRMAICSNKGGPLVRKEIKHLGWSKYFTAIVGASDAEHDKPHPAPVNLILNVNHLEAGPDVWFVGDMPSDMQVAHRSGCLAVGVGPDAIGDENYPPILALPDLEALLTGMRELLSFSPSQKSHNNHNKKAASNV